LFVKKTSIKIMLVIKRIFLLRFFIDCFISFKLAFLSEFSIQES